MTSSSDYSIDAPRHVESLTPLSRQGDKRGSHSKDSGQRRGSRGKRTGEENQPPSAQQEQEPTQSTEKQTDHSIDLLA